MGNLSLVFYIYSAEADLTCHAEQTSALIRPSFSSESQESRAAAAVMWCGAPTGNFPHLPETWGFGIQFVDYCVTICRIWQQQACEIREPLMVVDLRRSTHIYSRMYVWLLYKNPPCLTHKHSGGFWLDLIQRGLRSALYSSRRQNACCAASTLPSCCCILIHWRYAALDSPQHHKAARWMTMHLECSFKPSKRSGLN